MTQISQAPRLLVVSREPAVFRALSAVGESKSWRLEAASSAWEALERLESGTVPDLLLLQMPRGESDTMHVLRWLRRLRPELRIILLSDAEDTASENEALRLGVHDFLTWPFAEKELESMIRLHLASENYPARMEFRRDDIERLGDHTFFVSASPVMRKLRAQTELLAQANVPVLVVGEPGSGRDTTARLIHTLSVRSGCRFLKVNCAALPGDLLEKEIFGHRGGAAPGDDAPHGAGKLELCDRGTIFLDEIGEMPLTLQQKLVCFLHDKQLFKSRNEGSIDLDVRVVAATDTEIYRAVEQKRMREDLYYLLSTFIIHVPPLRERRDDIPFLLHQFMHRAARHYGLVPREFSPAVLDACQRYSWPGNARELESFVKRYLMAGEADLGLAGPDTGNSAERTPFSTISPMDIGVQSKPNNGEAIYQGKSLKSLVQDVKSEAERHVIATTLDKTGWNRKAAARLLKVSYRTILYKIEQYHICCPDPHVSPFLERQRWKSNGQARKSNDKAG